MDWTVNPTGAAPFEAAVYVYSGGACQRGTLHKIVYEHDDAPDISSLKYKEQFRFVPDSPSLTNILENKSSPIGGHEGSPIGASTEQKGLAFEDDKSAVGRALE